MDLQTGSTPENQTETTETEGLDTETGSETPETPAFTPNFEITVSDQKFEIPERFRSLITDEMSQKEVREIFEKAYGLDYAKPRHEKLKSEYQQYRQSTDPLLKSWGKLSQMYQKGDLDNFFKGLSIPDSVIAKYALSKLNYAELTPEQKAAYDQQVALREQGYIANEQAAHYQSEFERMSVENRTFQLDTVLARPDVIAMREAYDSKLGAGQFRDAIIDHAANVWKNTGKDISVEEAIQGVWSKIAPFVQTMQGNASPAQPGSNGLIPPHNTPVKPTIPAIAGRGTSPAKTKVKSIDDLKQKYKEISAQG